VIRGWTNSITSIGRPFVEEGRPRAFRKDPLLKEQEIYSTCKKLIIIMGFIRRR